MPTFSFNYSLSSTTLNTNTTLYPWVVDPLTSLFGDDPTQFPWVSIQSGASGKFTITNPYPTSRLSVDIHFEPVLVKQNIADVDDIVLPILGDTFLESHIYNAESVYVGDSLAVGKVDNLSIIVSPNTTLTFAPKVISGQHGLNYNLLAYQNQATPYTKLQINITN